MVHDPARSRTLPCSPAEDIQGHRWKVWQEKSNSSGLTFFVRLTGLRSAAIFLAFTHNKRFCIGLTYTRLKRALHCNNRSVATAFVALRVFGMLDFGMK